MLKKLQKLNREELKKINGGTGIEPCDIAPEGCPCKVLPGHPCLGGGGDPGGGGTLGYCPNDGAYIPCDQLCSDGRQPLCPL
ncbi:hypothetical protein MUU74_06130 [Chryseobacterium daecheongense]|uniref:hypothetical protein n=1 Tax=Chryseobacterium daecheongense TaxID=192389 RepID=UPI001FD70845|nr:hypothetical protein [Chryseobacterium daecheongense]UOU99533.1 hypothetical protein MUU74_06130 [Chryseobacterium daecheongense]